MREFLPPDLLILPYFDCPELCKNNTDSCFRKMNGKLSFGNAERKDASLILQFIKEFAEYEKLSDQLVADEITLETWIFDRQKAEVIFAHEDGKEVGFALFFHNFSAFLGCAGVHLEDLYVKPEYSGKGYGKAIPTGTDPVSTSTSPWARNPCRIGL